MKLNRFPEDKHDQINQLVEYATLMGLSGRDLVAIGGKMNRDSKRDKKLANMEIIKGFQCLPIGVDKPTPYYLNERFKLKTLNGTYNFESTGSCSWNITSLKTKVKKHIGTYSEQYDLPKSHWRMLNRYSVLLDIANGKLVLDF